TCREEWFQELDRKRKDDRRILFGGDLGQRLKITKLQRDRILLEDSGGLAQHRGGLKFAIGMNDLRAFFSLGLRLLRHGTLHLHGKVDMLDLDRGDLDTPRIGLLVEDRLQSDIEM